MWKLSMSKKRLYKKWWEVYWWFYFKWDYFKRLVGDTIEIWEMRLGIKTREQYRIESLDNVLVRDVRSFIFWCETEHWQEKWWDVGQYSKLENLYAANLTNDPLHPRYDGMGGIYIRFLRRQDELNALLRGGKCVRVVG